MSSNIFKPSVKSNLRKLLDLHRLNFSMSITMLVYLLKSALKLKITQNEKNINYYYLSLINCDCYHRKRQSKKFYFGRKNISLVARYGKQYSDLENLNQIFGRQEYMEMIGLYRDNFEEDPEYIIDAGANVGYATAFFNSVYPSALYISIEPDENNYAMLEENCTLNKIKNAYLVNRGLWNRNVYLQLANEDSGTGTWGFSFKESESPTTVQAMDFKGLLNERNCKEIDILKIDIEGAEGVLFEGDYMMDILSVTKVIGIEIHDHLARRLPIINQLKNAGFVLHDIGDMTFGYNSSLSK